MSTPGDGSGLPPELSPRNGGAAGFGGASSGAAVSRRGRASRVLRRAAVVASALVVLTGATGFAVSQHYLGDVSQVNVFKDIMDRPEKVGPAVNILLAGVENSGDLTPAQRREYHTSDAPGARSDTMMLIHISDQHKEITAVSFPRDSLVTIPKYTDANGVKHPASRNKLNAAYAFGGAKLTIETIEDATDIRIDHYVEVDLHGFVRMVNALGGVDVCTPTPLYDKDSNLNLPAGKTRLDGVQSLAFVRARHIFADQDLGRIRAQQRFVGSMVKRATATDVLLNPVKLNRVLSSVTKSITTDMDKDELVDQVMALRDYDPGNISFLTVPIGNGNDFVSGVGSVVSWDKPASRALFRGLIEDTPLNGPKKKAAKLTVSPGDITLQVLNGAGVQGLGSQTADALAGLGFGMADVAKNAEVRDQTETIVRYDPSREKASRTVIAALPGSKGEAVTGLGKTIEVVVGSSYDGVKKPKIGASSTPSSSATPKARTAADNVCE